MIVFTGLAGSGKSVQVLMLAATLGYEWISVGEILRNSLTGEEREKMLHGAVVKDEVAIGALEPKLKEMTSNKLIIDGFPRTVYEADWLIEMHQSNHIELDYVVHLITPKEVAMSRLLKRGRIDDHDDAINTRFSEYDKAIIPIMQHFVDANVACYEINGDQSIEQVHNDILEVIKT